jgi:hypothetical protein
VAGYPGPWPDLLARAVLDVLRRSAATGPGRAAGALLAAAARNLPVGGGAGLPVGGTDGGPGTGASDYAAALIELAEGGPPAWAPLLRRAAGAVAARRTFLEEIR